MFSTLQCKQTKFNIVMKKIVLTLIAVALSASFAFAQDLAQATETYNNGANSLSAGDKNAALEYFQKALSLATACGEDGAELVGNIKNVIPNLTLSIAKDFVKEAKFDEAIAQIEKAVAVAKEFGADEIVAEAETLGPQVLMSKASSLFSAKDFAKAAEAFKSVLASDPTNAAAALRLGQALNSLGDKDGAIAALEQAAANGQEANANKLLSTVYLQKAQTALKEKKFAQVIEAAVKANEYNESANAYKLAASAASQLKDNAKAISFYEKYVELAPTAKDANGVKFTIAALYQQAGNKAKALEFYQKVASDATYGAQAKQQIEALNK